MSIAHFRKEYDAIVELFVGKYKEYMEEVIPVIEQSSATAPSAEMLWQMAAEEEKVFRRHFSDDFPNICERYDIKAAYKIKVAARKARARLIETVRFYFHDNLPMEIDSVSDIHWIR